MNGDEQTGISLTEIDQVSEWIKFILSEYFKWYAAFLTLNLLGFAYVGTGKDRVHNLYIPIIFVVINPISISLAIMAFLYYTLQVNVIKNTPDRRVENVIKAI